MKIAALKERANYETRCAISPEVTRLCVKKGWAVCVEKGMGLAANFSDQAFTEAGAKVSSVPLEIIADADIILKVQPSPLIDQINEIDLAKAGAVIIGLLTPHINSQYLSRLAERQLRGIAMELVPRATKTQNMDVLSSQSNLAGYRAVIEACYYFDKIFPMMMTAAGTITPAKILILGVGVAGLQAIATAKRLGAVVAAYDVRAATKEQVESLGAKFISPEVSSNAEAISGYATEVSAEYKLKQHEFLANLIRNYDILITTAQIPGKPAPILIFKDMLKTMKPGSVIIDMAVVSGGNVEGSKLEELVVRDGIKIIGWSNLASRIPADSSKLYARNLYNFIEYAVQNEKFNFDDEIVKQMLV